MPSIIVRHNMEVAHRLSLTPGKCQNIHGHSMWIDLHIYGHLDPLTGLLTNPSGDPLEFGLVKQQFRHYIDAVYDHHLLLNRQDPWIKGKSVPGLAIFDGDPTTENLAKWIAVWASEEFQATSKVRLHETSVNAALAEATWTREGTVVVQ